MKNFDGAGIRTHDCKNKYLKYSWLLRKGQDVVSPTTLPAQNSLKPFIEYSSYLIENCFVQLESDGVGNSSTQLFVDFCRRQLSTTAVVFEVGSTSETDCSTFVRMRKAKWPNKDLGFVANPESQG